MNLSGGGIGVSGANIPEEVDYQEWAEQAEKVAIDPKDVKASDYIRGPAREDNEIYCDYMARKYWENLVLRQYLGGRTVWNSTERGEMRNMDRNDRPHRGTLKKERRKVYLDEIRKKQGVRTIDELNTTRKRKKLMKESKRVSR